MEKRFVIANTVVGRRAPSGIRSAPLPVCLLALVVVVVAGPIDAVLALAPPAPAAGLLPTPDPAPPAVRAVLAGRVVDAQTGAPVQNAAVHLQDTRWSGVSNENGRFVFQDVPTGSYLLVVEHLAYGTVRDTVEVDDARAVYDLEIRMSSEAIEIDPISITVMRTGPLVDVYDRVERMRRLGLGTTWVRDDIERAGVTRVSHLVGLLPGARLQPIPGRVGAQELRIHTRNNCGPSYYVDGIRTPLEGVSIDDHVSLTAVEAVEVYRGLASLPGEFADEHAQNCGAVAIWTRRGPPGYEPFGWRRLLLLVGFVSASHFLGGALF